MISLRLLATRLIAANRPVQANSYRSVRLSNGNQRRCRMMSTPPPMVNTSDLPMDKYHAISDATMEVLLDSLENLLDELGESSFEVEYHSGVLTLKLGEKGTYVINKQPPNKQLWLSSPFSGPKRYDYSEAKDIWLYNRDGCPLGQLLNDELSTVLGRPVDIGLLPSSQSTGHN